MNQQHLTKPSKRLNDYNDKSFPQVRKEKQAALKEAQVRKEKQAAACKSAGGAARGPAQGKGQQAARQKMPTGKGAAQSTGR